MPLPIRRPALHFAPHAGRVAAALATLAFSAIATAAAPPANPEAAVSAAQRQAVVDTLARALRQRYVYPERIEPVAARLLARAAHGDYDGARTVRALGEALDHDLAEFGNDRHFHVAFEPEVVDSAVGAEMKPTAEEVVQGRAESARRGFGIARLQRLPGNIGYLDLRGFDATEFVAPAYDAAMTLLGGTDALVLDLRNNGGGEPFSVTYLLSHFFAVGDVRHLNDLYDRPTNTTHEYWTLPLGMPRYLQPIVVLTSKSTFSGGEECAYDLQTQKRAVLYGETTGGGANPGEMVALGQGLAAFVPTGRAINAVTHKDWEKVGVQPDVPLPAADALKAGYLALLAQRVKAVTDAEERGELQSVIARTQSGDIVLPPYTPRR